MSPASRAEEEKAVRTRVWACSSTTESSRFHWICMWIWSSALRLGAERLAVIGRVSSAAAPGGQPQVAQRVPRNVDGRGDAGGGLVLHDQRRPGHRRHRAGAVGGGDPEA